MQSLWPPPKAPLPPHRLASLANALGVPLPALHTHLLRVPHIDPLLLPKRSPSPSHTSKYLLHVVPPIHLPHDHHHHKLTPPPPTASGYHTHYRRGILVPVHSSFQAQLAAIAKEYALPSTTGIVLYLVSSSHTRQDEDQLEEPGPRLSEEIWKHIWTRVLKVEYPDESMLPQSAQLYHLGGGSCSQSTSSLPQENASVTLRPLLSSSSVPSPGFVSPFTSSSTTSSTLDLRLNTSQTEPDTPDTSAPSQLSLNGGASKADSLELPGLDAPSIIPVLAKVEFDIDRRKAGWYEPWLRNRRINQAKRTGRTLSRENSEQEDMKPPISLLTGTKDAVCSMSMYSPDDGVSAVTSNKKPVPPPLVIVPGVQADDLAVPYEPSTLPSSAGSTKLAYLRDAPSDGSPRKPAGLTTGPEEDLDGYTRVRSPEESEKRVGAIFDDLDLGLDPSEDYDNYDPNDRRRSQFLMKAKLDEIERAMAQLSPRALKVDLEDDMTSRTLSSGDYLLPSQIVVRNGDLPPVSERANSSPDSKKAWPAIPFAALKESFTPVKTDGPPSPPRLAVNGVTTSAPVSYLAAERLSSSEVSPETERRMKELEEEYGLVHPVQGKRDIKPEEASVIPLSPDPFGRYPSSPETGGLHSSAYWGAPLTTGLQLPATYQDEENLKDRPRSSTVTSRFSIDSASTEEAKPVNRTTLMSMKSIKKLWRRSDKTSQPDTASANASNTGRSTPQPPPRPERPSQEEIDLPDVPLPVLVPPALAASGRVSLDQSPTSTQQLTVPTSGRSPSPTFGLQAPTGKAPSPLDRLHFDQESPYPTRLSPSVRYRKASPPPQPSPSLPVIPPETEKPTRKSFLKWRSKSRTGSVSQASATLQEQRTSAEMPRPPSNTGSVTNNGIRGRKSSTAGFSSPQPSTNIPPSPQIPEQFLAGSRQQTPVPIPPPPKSPPRPGKRESVRADGKVSRTSTDSHPPPERRGRSSTVTTRSSSPSGRSMASSHDSRRSIDTSQFEMVSPKAAALAYPYHGLDHD
ncbi:hypothetical protein AMATHDRAFT_2306 [Amanita thiersii Skay4041]|uniref:Uncharacterized protein n=1 Tax=Amanita thiersii Skay4041 TaxID=703135 RepID=A0A2A9NMU4_9AGAR|nr:hypothetical protein AMATHDRAFT_2306 [Amanita thiersii Skay4041]